MEANSHIPQEEGLDHTLTLMSEGYQFIPNRCSRFNSDIFETRLLGQKVICMRGEEAAQVFYDNERFKRKGAAPKRVQKTLFGKNAIQTMDGAAHKHRKQLFMSLMTPERLEKLNEYTIQQWQVAIDKWEKMDEVVLLDEAREIMLRVACQWAGVKLWAQELKLRATDLGAMIDAFGAVGPRFWRGRQARIRTESWIRNMIRQVRLGELEPPEYTPLYKMSWHRDLNNQLLSTKMAAVELLNIIRPIVAIARYVTFGALAMHEHPMTQIKLQSDQENYSQMFVQETRRYYPFGPFVGARVKNSFTWNNHEFQKGTLVLLDIYGTNHHPELWDDPEEFRPERFKDWDGSPFDFIPQGGGDYNMGHRCAGEWVTIQVMKQSLEFLSKRIDYQVPEQELDFSMVRMPTLPKSRFVINQVKKI